MNARQNKKPKLTAEPAYEHAHLVAQDLLDRIKELLHDLPAPGSDDYEINWADVGSLNHVNELLSQVVGFLADNDD